MPAVHRAFVEQREAVEGQLGEARQATLDARRVCAATVGALLAPAAPKAHALPKGITLVAVDEAGALAAGELAIFLCHIASHLAPGCPALSSHSHSHSPLQLERF